MSGRAAVAAAALAISCALAAAGSATPAEAAAGAASCGSGGGSSGGGSGSGGDYQIWQALSNKQHLCASGGNASSTDGTGGASVHVPCWWGPEYSPSGLEGYVDSLGESAIDTQFDLMHEYDINGEDPVKAGYQSTDGPEWESYNVGAKPLGEWYGLILNDGDTTDQLDACTAAMDKVYPKWFYWGVDGKTPADLPGGAPGFTARDLAEYVESVVILPNADVQSSQGVGAAATVGLPIWYWQTQNTKYTHLDFTTCAFGVCVTFKANAVSFTVDAGAKGAQSWSSGCKPQSTKTLGPVYTDEPASQNPTCGVKYSALATGVTPTVKTKWQVKITWTSDGGGSWSPPADPVIPTGLGPFGVQDVQAYNQPSPTAKPHS